ncbi:DUF6445 family protein [Sphingomonas sp.]|uniref:DUF6445 family protein n=1 Tax=Sphingomonas sp. TaxID=28214 RepID=UPI0035C85C6B
MGRRSIKVEVIGRERHLLVTIDDFVSDPVALRKAAKETAFQPAYNHYPGIRASVPDGYEAETSPILRNVFASVFGRYGQNKLLDISFSMVTTRPSELSTPQTLPHCDALGADRFALLHYLSEGDLGGTAFYRHRATSFEAIDEERAPSYFKAVDAELAADYGRSPQYIQGANDNYEVMRLAEPVFNRALVYPSFLLHSGIIETDNPLSSDPAAGRLTVTGFFSVGAR